MKVVVDIDRTHNPFDEACWVSRLRENLTSGSDGEGLETDRALTRIPRQPFTRQLFFKWIKQNLKIKSFLGTSKNAVLIQIWVAMSYYLLLSYIKYQTKYAHSLLNLSRVIRETLFDRKTLIDILTLKPERLAALQDEPSQEMLF